MSANGLSHDAEFRRGLGGRVAAGLARTDGATAPARRTAASRAALGWMILTLLSLLSAAAFWRHPDATLTSDTFTAPEFLWGVMRHLSSWSTFQQSHSPEFVPVDVVLGAVLSVTGSWRVAMAAWFLVVILWLMIAARAAGARAARMHPAALTWPIAGGCAICLLLAAASLPAEAAPAETGGLFFPWALLLMPGQHGGTFVLALSMALLLQKALAMPSAGRLAILAFLSFAALLSDQLMVVFLLIPVTAAALAGMVTGAIGARAVVRCLGAVGIGSFWGLAAASVFERQWMPRPTLGTALDHAQKFLLDPGPNAGLLLAAAAAGGLLIIAVWERGLQRSLQNFWLVFAIAGCAAGFAFAMALYEDAWTARYAHAILWWPVILAATRIALVRPARLVVLGGGLLSAIVSHARLDAPSGQDILGWRTPLATCLQREGLRTGLADYWIARRTSMSADWALQIEPLDSFGAARVWGNDWTWFARDIHQPGRAPAYRFIVMDRLPEARIAAVYGRPDRTVMCGSSVVWVFDDPGAVYRALAGASPFLAEVFASRPGLP